MTFPLNGQMQVYKENYHHKKWFSNDFGMDFRIQLKTDEQKRHPTMWPSLIKTDW